MEISILPGFTILDEMCRNEIWVLLKAFSTDDEQTVLIKKLINDNPSAHEIAEIIHEFHMAKDLQNKGVLRPVKLEKHLDKPFLVTELFEGVSLRDMQKEALQLPSFLQMAVRLSNILANLHHSHVIHKGLQPDNILVNPKTEEIKLTGFQQATKLSVENQHTNVSPYHLREQAAYMSPEQTGRMNRSLDFRSDLYSLGVIFYEMITAELPFKSKDPAELVHAHLAKIPPSPHEMDSNISVTVSNIIMKLLSKMPEYRYQTVRGLKEDLEKCMNQLYLSDEIKPFELGKNDVSAIFEKPNKLYGRKEAIEQLNEAFSRVCQGNAEFLLIPGPSGIGKTVLVNELQQPLVREKGYFISGKFVHLQKQIPYAPLIQAFESLLRQVLTENSDQIEAWRKKLVTGLSSYAGIIEIFLPEITWLIGPQPKAVSLRPHETHNRFRLAIHKFISVFTTKDHPLVLFLDDLQWADAATLDLIYYLLTHQENSHLLIIGAYRDNEVRVGHPLELMMKKLEDKGFEVSDIPVKPLEYSHVQQWISEIYLIEGENARSLIQLMHHITQGNPFYMMQLIQSFHEDEIVAFNHQAAKWEINVGRVNDIAVNETIISFILKRIEKLPGSTKHFLRLASCFGNQFDLKALSTIADKSYAGMAQHLWDSLEKGFVLPLDASYKWAYPNENLQLLEKQPPTYRFLHDKVQQAFYMAMTDSDRVDNHLKIGRDLFNQYRSNKLEEHVFDIVNHLNISRNQLTDQEKLDLIHLNTLAGEKAKREAAAEAALAFFKIGQELLPPNSWKLHYKLTYRIKMGLGESRYLNSRFTEAETTFDEVLAHAESNREKLSVYNLKITLYTHIHYVRKATDSGLAGLLLFDLDIDGSPNKWAVAKEFLLTKLALGKKKPENLLALPGMSNDDKRLIVQTMINTNAPTYHVDQNLATILMLRALRFTLKHGDTDSTALVYNNYALTLSAGFGDFDGSYTFGKLAIEHVEKSQITSLKARVYFVFGSFVNHWKNHMKYNLKYLEQSQQYCIETGNLHLAGACGSFIGATLLLKGDSLKDVAVGIRRQLSLANQIEYNLSKWFLGEIIHWTEVLSDTNIEPDWDYVDVTYDSSAAIMHYTIRLQMSYIMNNEKEAATILEKLEPLIDNKLVLVIAPEYYFYHSLWLIRNSGERSDSISEQTIHPNRYPVGSGLIASHPNRDRKKLKNFINKLRKWSVHSPTNYLHKYLLVKAESERDHNKDVVYLYNQAIESAQENGYIHDMALANECTARYYLTKQLPKSAKSYMNDAYLGYLKWGADRKAQNLLAMYPDLFDTYMGNSADARSNSEMLDINAVFEAAGIISGEVILEQLLSKLMHVVLTNAGAEKAFLILMNEDDLELVAANYIDGEVLTYSEPESIEEQEQLSVSIVNYVAKTQESVVLENAVETGRFTNDIYVREHNTKSILCLPIIYHGKLTGVLYLENNQSTHAFTQERIELLSLLSSQAATSIENAYLYANLETKVKKRTALLNKANQDLKIVNQDLANSEESRKRLLSNISHDLRSPIASINGYIAAIIDGVADTPEQQQHYLQRVQKRMTALNGLIHNLFDLAQLESGKSSFSPDVIPVDRLFQHLCGQFEIEVEQSGLKFEWIIPKLDGPQYPLVEVDVGQLEQVMTNLVSNAVKHTNQGSIRISLLLDNTKQALIAVEDSGSGIPESELPFVFDRFYTKRKKGTGKGHGLGLSICKEIITIHKGTIWVESNTSVGTTFYFSLPIFNLEENIKNETTSLVYSSDK